MFNKIIFICVSSMKKNGDRMLKLPADIIAFAEHAVPEGAINHWRNNAEKEKWEHIIFSHTDPGRTNSLAESALSIRKALRLFTLSRKLTLAKKRRRHPE